MSEARCPRCHEAIRLPEPLPASDASGQCPWCQETFAVHELLDQLPPMLQIIGAGSVTVETDEEDDSSFMLRDEEPSTPAALPTSAPRPTPAFSATPRRQKKSSPVKTVLQIIGGGLVSIPLAIGILLLLKYFGLANPNVGIWPLDGTAFDAPVTATQPRPVTENNRQSEPEEGGRMLGEDMPDFGELGADSDFDPMRDNFTDDANEDPFPAFDRSEPDKNDQGGDATDDPENLLSMSPAEITSPLSASSGEGLAAMPEPLNSDIEAVVAAAQQASTALANHSDPATRSDALKDLYLELAKLGELASPDQQTLYAELFAQLRREDQLETMGRFGKRWFSAPSRLYEGIFATGTLVQEGDGYEFRWEEGESVPVHGWDSYPDDPTTFAGKEIAMLAQIDAAAEPRHFLIGYLERLDRGSENAEQP